MDPTPKTRYAKARDGAHIAYQVVGGGPLDLVIVHAWISHLEVYWEWPRFRRLMDRLGRSCRTVHFDKRGMGLSDRLATMPTFDARLDDVTAVLDSIGSDRAALFGWGDGGALAALFAATYPERTTALVLWGGEDMKMAWAPDYPWGATREEFEEDLRKTVEHWGDDGYIREIADTFSDQPSRLADDPAFGPWFSKLMRSASSPGDLVVIDRIWWETDALHVLPAIHVPTACLIRDGWSERSHDSVTWLTGQIPGLRVLRIPGSEGPVWAEDVEVVADAIVGFLGSVRAEESILDRSLATVMFTDIVGSTAHVARMGDRAWGELVQRHHGAIRSLVARYRGSEVDTAGDGFFATFDGPARAVRCAQACIDVVRAMGLEIRAGVHAGEVESIGGKVAGIAVNIGARVGALASPSEVLVSQTVKDLVAGSGLVFEDRGEHELRGVPDRWRLYAVAAP
jgi:class 3 adenylate cyclase